MMICKKCNQEMELVDKDPALGRMFICYDCRLQYIDAGPGNAFDQTGWKDISY